MDNIFIIIANIWGVVKINIFNLRNLSNKMQAKNKLPNFRDIVVILLGIAMSSLGTSIFYAADLGSAPLATFFDGIHDLFSVSYGTANILINIVLLIALFIANRTYINYGTILCVFASGLFLNLFSPLIENIGISNWNIFLRIICTGFGTIIMGAGLGLYVAVGKGLGPLEGLVIHFSTKSHLPFLVIKIIQDFMLVLFGIIMGGQWGIGTFIATVFTGPILQLSMYVFQGLFARHRSQA